ncbi:MAG: type 1 glutamine amidotransferase [Hymenobacteraceae bacterium]|nr:type 1 glutamine amidotransferase [Hymenobacteraceae bacterium]
MRIHVMQHAAFEGPGHIGTWAAQGGHQLRATHWYEPVPRVPVLADLDVLVVLGGGMSVHDTARYPWLATEKVVIRAVVAAGRPVLGICLGAQLLAEALGATVGPNAVPEIGFFPVDFTADARAHPVLRQAPAQLAALHWHADTFELPAGATRVASSAACRNQGFVVGDRVVGLQFHPEMTATTLRALIRYEGAELIAGPSVQPAATLRANENQLATGHAFLESVLDGLVARIKGR